MGIDTTDRASYMVEVVIFVEDKTLINICIVAIVILSVLYGLTEIQSRQLEKRIDGLTRTDILEPCPLCSGNAIVQPVNDSFYIQCEDCKLKTTYFHSKEELVEYWNTRNETKGSD